MIRLDAPRLLRGEEVTAGPGGTITPTERKKKMKNTMRVVGTGITGIAVLTVIFLLGFYGLGWQKFFSPKQAEIKREVWENTQSYTEGAARDLATYLQQYTKADDPADKETIRQVVIMRFANLDAKKINNAGLRGFLVSMRGY